MVSNPSCLFHCVKNTAWFLFYKRDNSLGQRQMRLVIQVNRKSRVKWKNINLALMVFKSADIVLLSQSEYQSYGII